MPWRPPAQPQRRSRSRVRSRARSSGVRSRGSRSSRSRSQGSRSRGCSRSRSSCLSERRRGSQSRCSRAGPSGGEIGGEVAAPEVAAPLQDPLDRLTNKQLRLALTESTLALPAGRLYRQPPPNPALQPRALRAPARIGLVSAPRVVTRPSFQRPLQLYPRLCAHVPSLGRLGFELLIPLLLQFAPNPIIN